MSDRTSPNASDDEDLAVPDPDDGSTWNTIDNTAVIGDLVDESDLENFLVEPIPNPFGGDDEEMPEPPD